MTVSLVKAPAPEVTAPEVTPGKITLKAVDLAEALRVAALFAGTDATIPMLGAVRLECNGVKLTALATDRYTAALYTTEAEGDVLFTANIPTANVRIILTTLKGAAAHTPVELTRDGDRLTVRTFDGQVTVTLNNDDFPKLRHLIPDAHDGDGTGNVGLIGFNPAYLARLAKVATGKGRHEPARLTFTTPLKPVRVDIGENFVGLIMPVRIGDK